MCPGSSGENDITRKLRLKVLEKVVCQDKAGGKKDQKSAVYISKRKLFYYGKYGNRTKVSLLHRCLLEHTKVAAISRIHDSMTSEETIYNCMFVFMFE